MIVVTKLTERIESCIGFIVQKSQEVLRANKVYLAILEHLSRCLMWHFADRRAQSEDLASVRDPKDQRLSVTRIGREFYTPLAQHVYAIGFFAFAKEGRTLGVGICDLYRFKGLEHLGLQIAKEPFPAQLAASAIMLSLKRLSCFHLIT